MWSVEFLIQMVAALIGTAAFAVMFRLNPRHLPWAIVGGGVTFLVYELVNGSLHSVFASAFLSSAVSALYSEFFARWKRAPAAIFTLLCAIPIVPGGSLYRTMFCLISKDFSATGVYLGETVAIAIGIAGGLAAISLLVHLINGIFVHFHKKRKKLE
jgi:uncharacterized membrane protein YjjB (DUF3815 family)